MIELLPFAATALGGIAVGGAGMHYVKTRKVTTKAEAIKIARLMLAQAKKMGGAAEDMELARAELANEANETALLSSVAASLNGPQS